MTNICDKLQVVLTEQELKELSPKKVSRFFVIEDHGVKHYYDKHFVKRLHKEDDVYYLKIKII